MTRRTALLSMLAAAVRAQQQSAARPIQVVILTGRDDHDWRLDRRVVLKATKIVREIANRDDTRPIVAPAGPAPVVAADTGPPRDGRPRGFEAH